MKSAYNTAWHIYTSILLEEEKFSIILVFIRIDKLT